MSLLGKGVSILEKIAPGSTAIFGGAAAASMGLPPQVGMAAGSSLAGRYGPGAQTVSLPGAGATQVALPALPVLGAGAVIAGRALAAGAGWAMRGAMTLCRRHPQWCMGIGGTAAVAAAIQSGQIPAPRRGRRRGISASEFRGFNRVHRVLSKFCAPRMKIRRKGAACR